MTQSAQQKSNQRNFITLLSDTFYKGDTIEVRGCKISELLNKQIEIFSSHPFMLFPSRKYDLNYFKAEMLWKLKADPYDDSIKEKAKMWESVQNNDGSFNSNYGQYWFGQQMGLFKAFNELVQDRNSRRSTIPMLSTEHIGHGVKDTVCTGHITFHIRNGVLNMSVSMRSSDQIFGLGTDLPTFAVLHRIMLGMIRSVYMDVVLGTINLTADSSHIYERHFRMVKDILENQESIDIEVKMPLIGTDEAFKLAACKGNVDASWGEFSNWLVG